MIACGLMFPLAAAVNRRTLEVIQFIAYKLPVVGGGGGGGGTLDEVDPPHPINTVVDKIIEHRRRKLTDRIVSTSFPGRWVSETHNG
jgi:hypothetical protein